MWKMTLKNCLTWRYQLGMLKRLLSVRATNGNRTVLIYLCRTPRHQLFRFIFKREKWNFTEPDTHLSVDGLSAERTHFELLPAVEKSQIYKQHSLFYLRHCFCNITHTCRCSYLSTYISNLGPLFIVMIFNFFVF